MSARKDQQLHEQLWVAHAESTSGPGPSFYKRLNELLDQEKFDKFAVAECAVFAPPESTPLLLPRTNSHLGQAQPLQILQCGS
jgi:hypothetical protein